MVEQAVILCRCPKEHKLYGIRVDQIADNNWVIAWAFKVNAHTAEREGFGKREISSITGVLNDYPGCPYCGSKLFIHCGCCGKETCMENERTSKCEWCGNEGEIQYNYKGEIKYRCGEM